MKIDITQPINAVTLLRYKIAWLPTVGIVAAALSIGVIFLGATRLGTATLVTSLSGIFLSVTLAKYANFLAIAGLVAAVIAVLAVILKVRKTNVALVKGVQAIKDNGYGLKDRINEIVTEVQDSDVTREVKRIKKDLAIKAAKLKAKL